MVRYSMLVVYRCSMTILFIGLLGLLVAGIADAGVNDWTTNGPEGANIYALAIDPNTPATIYAGTNGGGVFKSTNGGGNWTPINTGLTEAYVTALAIDPNIPATIYAGTHDGGVFKSTNGGGGWTAINAGLTDTDVRALALASDQDGTTVFAGTYGGSGVFFRSPDGEYWGGCDLTAYVPALAIDPINPSILYAGTEGNGVFKCTNCMSYRPCGWGVTSVGLMNTDIRALAVDPNTPATIYAGTNGGGVFKSTNGGANWTAINTGLTNTYIYALAIDPDTPTTVYAGTGGGGVFKSTIGGGHWTAINTGLTNTYVTALAIDPINPSILYAGTYGNGVFEIEQETCPTPGVVSNPSPSSQAANVSTNPTLSWSDSSNADSYDVYFGTTSDPTTLVGSPTSTSFPLTGLNLSTTYYWKIVARNNCGQSTSGPVWTFSTIEPSTYTLTVNINPSATGSVTKNPDKLTYVYGEQVILTATPAYGYTFYNWTGDASGTSNPITFTINSNETVAANFATISVTPTAYDFGNVKMKKSKTASFVVTNSGKTNLSITSAITGTDASMFKITSGSGSKTIKPVKSLTIKVAFKPTSTGPRSANLEITSNDPVRPIIDMPLSGTGQ